MSSLFRLGPVWRRIEISIPYRGGLTLTRAAENDMRIEQFSFGSIRIDGLQYQRDVVIDRGQIRLRSKKPSKPFREAFGHTPLSIAEDIPWKCRRLVVGTGAHGALPVLDDVRLEAAERNVKLLVLPTQEAIEALRRHPRHANAILHLTC
jgi:hypothetical protein